jgi:hypothetical protein
MNPLEDVESKEEKDKQSQDGLRKRRENLKEEDGPLNQEEEGRDVSKVDPLHWFGILPPQSLRQAQIEFRRVSQIAVQLASISARMCELEERISNNKTS